MASAWSPHRPTTHAEEHLLLAECVPASASFVRTRPGGVAQEVALPRPVEEDGRPARRPLLVLVVDDDPDTADSTALLVRLWGHDTLTAPDGPRALALAWDRRPDAVLLALALPAMDGYEVARRLRQDPGPGTPLLVAMTAYGQEEDVSRVGGAGFDHYFLKGADPAVLEQVLAPLRGDG
jgi:CheY-like chemotaxis protein